MCMAHGVVPPPPGGGPPTSCHSLSFSWRVKMYCWSPMTWQGGGGGGTDELASLLLAGALYRPRWPSPCPLVLPVLSTKAAKEAIIKVDLLFAFLSWPVHILDLILQTVLSSSYAPSPICHQACAPDLVFSQKPLLWTQLSMSPRPCDLKPPEKA